VAQLFALGTQFSGYGTQTAIWAMKLREMGHEIAISSYWGIQGAATQWEGIPVYPGFGPNYCSTSLEQHAKLLGADLIITLGDVWVMDANILKGLPVAHWLPSDCRPMSLADRNIVEQTGAELIAMSKFGYDNFKKAGYRPVYVPHGIDTTLFKPLPDREKLRTSCGVNNGEFVIGMNSANNDAIRKAIPEQMLAFAKFAQNHDDAVLTLHSGVHQDGGQDLEAVAENLGILDKVRVVDQYRYTAGQITPQDLNEWYNVIDVLSAASYGEGYGLPIMEAQSTGTPVITTKCSSMEELNPFGIEVEGEPFWNGVHKGWWTRPSVSGLYRAFEEAYDARNDVKPRKLRQFAKEYDKERVAVSHMGPAVEELLDRMSKKKP
jgi:glycosyltransferase involved in cell wall biosynthesis